MPSYRVVLTIGALRPGVGPQAVAPAAADAAAQLTVVEATDIAVVAGTARVTVRYVADDEEIAVQVAEHTAAATNVTAAVQNWIVTERVGGSWVRVG